ncbi:hypothetical protein M404DRAFT_101815, partial [Pisolithus tinctorius Marx 270]
IEDEQQQGPIMRASGLIESVVASQDGRWLASGDRGWKATIWNAATHEKVREFTEYSHCVLAVDISSDGTKIASTDWNHARIFSITSGTRLLPPIQHDKVIGIKFSPDGSRFATASEIQGFRVYSTHNGDVLFDSGKNVSTGSWSRTRLAWSPDGQQLFVAERGKIICFDLSKSSSSAWSIHENQSLAYIASNGRFIACAAGLLVSLWDCVSHEQIGSIISHTAELKCIALSPSGGYLACA